MLKVDVPYGLHDTKITEFLVERSGIILYFANGIYTLFNNREVSLTRPFFMRLYICYFAADRCYEHIEILQYKKNRYFEVPTDQFIKDVKTSGFDIDMDYYAPFSRSMLIRGFVGKMKTDMIVTEIKTMSVSFQE